MAAKPRVATSESRVNFEALWRSWPDTERHDTPTRPHLLGEERTRKLFADRRYFPNVIARLSNDLPHRSGRKRDGGQARLTRSPRGRSRRQQIAAELGLVFSTCTLAQARRVIADCNRLEKQALLDAFFGLRHWRNSRLGQEIAPVLHRSGL